MLSGGAFVSFNSTVGPLVKLDGKSKSSFTFGRRMVGPWFSDQELVIKRYL